LQHHERSFPTIPSYLAGGLLLPAYRENAP
jgi:hypothetical protein